MKAFTSILILGALLGVTVADNSFFSDLFGKIESNPEVQKAIGELKNIYNNAQASAEKLSTYFTNNPDTVETKINETFTNILKYYHSSTKAFNEFSDELKANASKLISQSGIEEKYLQRQNEVLQQIHDFYSRSILPNLVDEVKNSPEVQKKIDQLVVIYNQAKTSADKLANYLNNKRENVTAETKTKISETLTNVLEYYQSSTKALNQFAEELNYKASKYLSQADVREKYVQLQKQILQFIQDALPLNLLADLSAKAEKFLAKPSSENNAEISE